MNEGLAEIKNSVSSLLNWAVQSMEVNGLCYLLYRVRNDVYVPIFVSEASILETAEYYLAFSRFKETDFSSEPAVVQLECDIPTLLQRGRVESLFFRESKARAFWQELIPASHDTRMVLVRSACEQFQPISKQAREFALHWSCYAHSQWDKAGNTFFSGFLSKTEMATCREVIDQLANHLGDKDPFPPFYDLINFQVLARAAHESVPESDIRCNPLGFNTGVVIDFRPDTWPWISAMPAKCAGDNHYFTEYIPTEHPHALPTDAFYKSIVEQTEDLVVKVCELTAADNNTWQLFARHNRGKKLVAQPLTPAQLPDRPISTDNALLAVATILSCRPIEDDHLVTFWAVNPRNPSEAHSVGSRIDPKQFPKLNPFNSDHDNKVSAQGGKSDESVLITFQPATGCQGESLKLLKEKLQCAADAALMKIQMLAPAARLKAIYGGLLDLNWKRHFKDCNGRKLHDVEDFKANANDEEWRDLGESVIKALQPLTAEVRLWPCLLNYDASQRGIYACIGKSFDQKSICPELATCLAGGAPTAFDTKGYWLLQDQDCQQSKTREGASELAAGLILLGKSLRLSSTEYSPTMFPMSGVTNRIGALKFGFEGRPSGQGDTAVMERQVRDRTPLERVQEFARCCFNELPTDEFGQKHWVQSAVQLIRPFTRVFTGGFVARDGKMLPAIYTELRLTEKP